MMISLVIGCFEFSIFAGLAKGNPYIEVVSKLEIAEFMQRPIGRLQRDNRNLNKIQLPSNRISLAGKGGYYERSL
jgi:hypothetical protein